MEPEHNIVIDLERSEYIQHRAELMKTLVVPKLSEAKLTLEEWLSEIIFQSCEEALKLDFGLAPPLKGAGDELWVSPSDLLIGKVALKPPLTAKHIQALTHQGILEIGAEIEKKYWNQMELEKERALMQQERMLRTWFDDILQTELKDCEARERAACAREIEKINKDFDTVLFEELANLEKRLRDEFEITYNKQEEELRKEWERNMQAEIQKTVKTLTLQFLDNLEKQEQMLAKQFKMELQKLQIKQDFEINLEKVRCQETLKQLRYNLECKNVANLMYMLCVERRKCCDEKQEIERHFKEEIRKLTEVIAEKTQKIQKITEKMNKQIKEVSLRETCLLAIIKEFQKFINFALRASPTQAEFLLSVDRMMTFELAETILKSKFAELKPCHLVQPWPKVESPRKTSDAGSTNLFIKDYHNCFNELNPPLPEGAPVDFLPAFTYKNRLFLREDFRNMVSQGITISPSNELWSKDVEILIDTLRKSVTEVKIEGEASKDGADTTERTTGSLKFTPTSEKTKKVSLENEIYMSASRKASVDRAKTVLKNTPIAIQGIDFTEIGQREHRPTLLATASSVELLIQKGSVRYLGSKRNTMEANVADAGSLTVITNRQAQQTSNPSVVLKLVPSEQKIPETATASVAVCENESVIDHKDSVIQRRTSLLRKCKEFTLSPKDSIEVMTDEKEIKQQKSLLTSARNSIEMLRESLLKLKEAVPCKKREPFKSAHPSGPAAHKDICCEKCLKGKDSIEVLTGGLVQVSKASMKDSRRESSLEGVRSVKMSHIEVFNLKDPSNVSFRGRPIIYDADLTNVENIYLPLQKKPPVKKKAPPKDKFINLESTLRIAGDPLEKSHLQDPNEFTVDRIRSFLALFKENPNLIKTFTAVTK